jgi:dCTP deaminase
MSVITKKQIIEQVKNGQLSFTPALDSFQLQEHSVDLRLGYTFLIPKTWHLTVKGREMLDITNFDRLNAQFFDVVELEQGQFFELLPGEYVIVSTLEKIKLSNSLMGVLYPRSSTNRRGLSLDLTGLIDAGFEGPLTLPLRNNNHEQVARLYPGERICQVVFEELSSPVVPRKDKYVKKDIIEGTTRESSEEGDIISAGNIKILKNNYPVVTD